MKIRKIEGQVLNPEGVEINAVLHCNMSCKSCSHLSPLFSRSIADPRATAETLGVLAKYYHASFAKILGGEPLLHPDLLGLIRAVRESGISDRVLVCTNGILLRNAPLEFWKSVDEVEVSMYPSHVWPIEDIRRVSALAREHQVEFTVNRYGHFRVAYSELGTNAEPLVARIFNTCKLAHDWLAHTVYEGWMFRCPQSIFLPRQLENGRWDAHVDGIRIEDAPDFADRLFAFLTRATPLQACHYCLGSVGQLHPHQEVRRTAWRQYAGTADLIDYEFLEQLEQDITLDDGCVEPHHPNRFDQ